jgi:amidase
MTFANFAQPFNLSGQPGVSVPAVWSEQGLPIGVQLVGRRFGEATLLQVARQLETVMPWADRRPSVSTDQPLCRWIGRDRSPTPQ